MEKVSNKAGCYCFCNKYGNSISIVYIGKAKNLKKRIEQQFLNNVRLMIGLKNFGNGTRILMYCEVETRMHEKLKILESQLIKSAAVNGHTLLNVHGTRKLVKHEIEFIKTNKAARTIFERKMKVFS
ncbi:GIY-YIG nuclease family protein [Chitinophaga eiseniae]|nr:GIY-YIG nuclease family protein [Chitinophaga eiseniae]